VLDYSQQTPNYLAYPDFDDPRLEQFFYISETLDPSGDLSVELAFGGNVNWNEILRGRILLLLLVPSCGIAANIMYRIGKKTEWRPPSYLID